MPRLSKSLLKSLLAALLASFSFPSSAPAQATPSVPPAAYSAMKWRLLGPFRAGRVSAVAGIPSDPATYYIGTPGGGLWRTTNAGQTWQPITDGKIPVASIGAVAVADSDPKIIYVGTGEQTPGNGMYRSADGGNTWSHIGLDATHAIQAVIIDHKDPNIVVVAASGGTWPGASGRKDAPDDRGIFRTTDGGRSWKKVWSQTASAASDANTPAATNGATSDAVQETAVMDMTVAPDNNKILYAATETFTSDPLAALGRPTETKKQDAHILRSSDGGNSWSPVAATGLPSDPMGRIGIAVAPGSKGKTIFAIATQGLFRSDDSGSTWKKANNDPRIVGNWYFSRVFVDPKDPNIVYIAQTSMYRSTDGGKTFEAWMGAPSGDDFHLIWINPADTRYLLLGVDQGAIVSIDAGKSWSSWYNQATGQFYHVATDDRFPYYVYAAQQDSGTAAIASRSDFGEITDRDWAPTGGFEFAYIVPDPADENIVYTGGWYGSVLKFDRRTSQVTHVFVRTDKYRTSQMAPIAFAPSHWNQPHTMYVGAQYVMKSTDGGVTWQEASPDLTELAATGNGGTLTAQQSEKPAPPRRTSAITALAPSTIAPNQMWAGTGNCLIQLTRDGHAWTNVSSFNTAFVPAPSANADTQHPAPRQPRCTISAIEASRHDPAEAYVAISVPRELRPIVLRTRDFGATWTTITTGLDPDWVANVVREDTTRKGLLYAGTQNAAYVSFDDGDHWQSLQNNLPVTPVTDLEVHGNDLVASTYGRSLWVLDDLTPLRQWKPEIASRSVHLFTPEEAIRTRWDMNQDTPLPIETPVGKNPPDGAIIDYWLDTSSTQSAPSAASDRADARPNGAPLKLDIYDSHGDLVRQYSSVAAPPVNVPSNVPEYWFREAPVLSTHAGLNRFVWDLRYPAPKTQRYSYYGNHLDYIEYTLAEHAIPGETPRDIPMGALVAPGTYTVALTFNGRTYKQPLTVTIDPRVTTSQQDLEAQLQVERNIDAQMSTSYDGYEQTSNLRAVIKQLQATATGKQDVLTALKSLDDAVAKVEQGKQKDPGFGPLNRDLARLFEMVGSGDSRPATPLIDQSNTGCAQLNSRIIEWKQLQAQIATTNSTLRSAGLPPLPATSSDLQPVTCLK